MKRKLISLLLCITLVFPCILSSCGGYKSKYKAVMEYNGIKLTEEMYYYWMSTYKRNILLSYSDAEDTEEFWSKKYDDTRTVEQYFAEVLNERIMNYLIAQDLYKKNTLKLSKAEKLKIKDDINEKIDFYGGRSELNSCLSRLMLNIEGLKEIYTWESKHDCVYDYLFGEDGPLSVTDTELEEYYENNYYHIDYAVFYLSKITTDEDGDYVYDENGDLVSEELTEEELNKKYELIAEFEGKANAGEDFSTLIKQYSEYSTEKYVNGFYMSINELDIWGYDIYKAVKEAEVGDICKVEEEGAVFFVKKLPLTELSQISESDILQLENLVTYATSSLYDEFFSELSGNVKVHKDIMNRYKLSEIEANPYYSI